MPNFHVVYVDPAGHVLQQSRQDAEQVMADAVGKQVVGVLAPLLSKPMGSHTFAFTGQASATLSLMWRLSVRGSCALQINAGEEALCTALLLSGTKPEVDQAALSAFHETLAGAQQQAGGTAADEVLQIRGRPLVLAIAWGDTAAPSRRQAVGAALACFATAFFRGEGVV